MVSLSPHESPREHTVFRFEDLVFDVQAYIIISFILTEDLRTLTRVSRHISSLATRALYRDVRLLFGSPLGPDGAFTKRLTSSQRAFKSRILSRPEYAPHVHSLAWQVISSGPCDHVFTEFFPQLVNLTKIHVVDAYPNHICELKQHPSALFPRVMDVTLTGTTSLPFAMSMLHSPHHLKTLSLDTITPHAVNLNLLQWIGTSDLSSCQVLCLRSLCPQPWDQGREDELFSAWRDALCSVRQTAEEVVLGFREHFLVPRDASARPSAGRFAQLVAPVFWEERWPRLRVLRLEGIDLDGSDSDTAQYAVQLRAAIPEVAIDTTIKRVQRVWRSEDTKSF